ncbi:MULTISPECIES: tetratricopeptide repeat protein [unclassified Psychrobacter]|uniref:tetratricopeptide repeat protein n=1 Tax=unclassified Psychrobacter TaxID=196806 RepID=UPI003FD5C45B
MLLFAQQSTTSKHQRTLSSSVLMLGLLTGTLTLSACQTAPSTTATERTTTVVMSPASNDSTTDDSYPIEPYNPPAPDSQPQPQPQQNIPSSPSNDAYTIPPYQPIPEPYREEIIITPPRTSEVTPPIVPSHGDLLERARANSQQQSRATSSSNSDLPAFRNLMQNGTNQLRANDLTAAENSFTRAQRLAPRSSAVYFYLAQVALKKNQPRKAEAMARRGLSVSQDDTRRRALWQIILRSGQLQNNARVINEAQRALR